MTCSCHGKGILKIVYQTGEPYDVAICDCPRGQRLRVWHMRHPDWIETVWQLGPEHRIAWLEDFSDDPEPKPLDAARRVWNGDRPAYTQAGQLTPPRNRTR